MNTIPEFLQGSTPADTHLKVCNYLYDCITTATFSGRVAVDYAALQRVVCSRGRNAGRLLATCPAIWGPNADHAAAAIWMGMQPNPWKMKFSAVMLPEPHKSTMYALSRFKFPRWLDKDLSALAGMGVL